MTDPDQSSRLRQDLKRAAVGSGVLWAIAALLKLLFPPPSGWWELGADTLVFLGTLPFIYVMRHRAGVFACGIWIAGMILAFMIKPASKYIWVPDAALLLGFLPLLFKWRPGWPWLIFGVPTFFIGIVLLVSSCLPDEPFLSAGKQVIEVKHHLAQYHPPWAWAISGFFCTLAGFVLTVRDIVRWLQKKNPGASVHADADTARE